MNYWALIALLTAVTLAERLSFILWADRWSMPVWLERALHYVPVTVLSALVLPSILRTDGLLDLSLLNPKLIAASVAVLLAWRTRNVLITIIVGMALFWTIEGLLLAG